MNEMNRREFLKTAARVTVGATVLAGGVALVAKEGKCESQYPCERCEVFGKCELSKAEEARRGNVTE